MLRTLDLCHMASPGHNELNKSSTIIPWDIAVIIINSNIALTLISWRPPKANIIRHYNQLGWHHTLQTKISSQSTCPQQGIKICNTTTQIILMASPKIAVAMGTLQTWARSLSYDFKLILVIDGWGIACAICHLMCNWTLLMISQRWFR